MLLFWKLFPKCWATKESARREEEIVRCFERKETEYFFEWFSIWKMCFESILYESCVVFMLTYIVLLLILMLFEKKTNVSM